MENLKNISKRSAIILVCMVLLFGNLFIPISAGDDWCPPHPYNKGVEYRTVIYPTYSHCVV